MTHEPTLAADIFNWLARLPFLAAEDLALLTGQPSSDVEAALREMDRDGQVEWVTPSSPELDTSRLYVLTEPARLHVAADQRWQNSGECALPVTHGDVIRRLASIEATVALNAFATNLVVTQRRIADRGVGDLWSTAVARRRDAWWPPGTHGFGFLQCGDTAAPFFVVVDRAGAPPAHRSAMVAAWYRFRDGGQVWGPDSLPPILLLCPGADQEQQWERAVIASAEHRGVVPLDVLLADRSAPFEGLVGPIWRRPGRSNRSPLDTFLPWLPSPANPALRVHAPPPSERPTDRLHGWAQATVVRSQGVPTLDRIAALSLTTSSIEKRLIDCLGRHPLLTEAELASVLQIEPRLAKHAVAHAEKSGLIVRFDAGHGHHSGLCLAVTAMRMMSVRDGVPARRYARHAPVTAMPSASRDHLPTLLLQYEHTIGVNSFFAGWPQHTNATRPRLVAWLNAAESAVRVEVPGGRCSVRPDGSGQVFFDGRPWPFMLEWDRGTERLPVVAAKLARYAIFYGSSGEDAPALLFVTTTPHREALVRRVAEATLGKRNHRLLTTTASLVERLGPASAIWRDGTEGARTCWPQPVPDPNTPAGDEE
ncbi:MAG: replication-relaxation family protein [Dehalococcoidia bacterium]|nr:replication-relaxation family protein [Dehalococcoidia bacterium]